MKTEVLKTGARYPLQIEMDHNEWAVTIKALIQLRALSTEKEETETASDLIEYMSKVL